MGKSGDRRSRGELYSSGSSIERWLRSQRELRWLWQVNSRARSFIPGTLRLCRRRCRHLVVVLLQNRKTLARVRRYLATTTALFPYPYYVFPSLPSTCSLTLSLSLFLHFPPLSRKSRRRRTLPGIRIPRISYDRSGGSPISRYAHNPPVITRAGPGPKCKLQYRLPTYGSP